MVEHAYTKILIFFSLQLLRQECIKTTPWSMDTTKFQVKNGGMIEIPVNSWDIYHINS